ncbi:MAG: alpha-amylase [Bacteroidaceae bacterium]|nr:alpha-amylase [Bacteroidaceae bacterium]
MKKHLYVIFSLLILSLTAAAQGWPSKYQGVMLQGFYWDSFNDSQWTNLESQADELSEFFQLVWIPQSANCGGSQSMGYDDFYWFSNYNSSFGNERGLRSMISTFKQKGIGTIADVVINHRKTVSNWVDFPAETYKGVTYQLLSTDICANDDGGATKRWADQNGYKLSQNNDDGEEWSGMRDLDHSSANVQTNVLAYLDFLLNDLGYTGFRYDMTKGYAAKWTALYNSTTKPEFSVGEYWDGNYNTLISWLNGTKSNGQIQSAVFDFATRYVARDVFNYSSWSKIGNAGLAKQSGWGRYAVTFCENHDTQYRSATEQQDPIRANIAAANAYILLINGTPCVFLKHWLDYKNEIKQLIYARHAAGITNESSYSMIASSGSYSAIQTTQNANCDIITAFGVGYTAPAGYKQIITGSNYQVFLPESAETPWISVPSCEIKTSISPVLTAVTSVPDAKLVYTLDGSDPTPSSKTVDSGSALTISEACVLKVGLLVGGVVKNIQTRHYTVAPPFSPYDITVYVNADKVAWTKVNFWTWGGDNSHTPKNPNWPGDAVTQTKVIGGKSWYYQTYTINSATDYVNFVFSTDTGNPQTVDINNIRDNAYFEISTDKTNGKHNVSDVTEPMAISNPVVSQPSNPATSSTYNLAGQKVQSNYRGIVIKNGKKVVR